MLQQLDFSNAPGARDFTCAAFNPSGEVAALGGYNSISSCSFNTQANSWELAETKQVCIQQSSSATICMLVVPDFINHC